MTIAIGMLCGGGAVVATDTQGCLGDGTAKRIKKIEAFSGKGMSFVIAYSGEDADSARGLIKEIVRTVESKDVSGWGDIESAISEAMAAWRTAFAPEPIPTTSLVVAFCWLRHGLKLYSCELPNNVLPQPEGYIAIGAGAAVTNPLAITLFDPCPQSRPTQMVCRQIAYLMYRAKKDNYNCKGGTDAIFLEDTGNTRAIDASDFKNAEAVSFQLDWIFNCAATATLGGNGEFLAQNIRSVGAVILMHEAVRGTEFHDSVGNVIGPQLPLPADPL